MKKFIISTVLLVSFIFCYDINVLVVTSSSSSNTNHTPIIDGLIDYQNGNPITNANINIFTAEVPNDGTVLLIDDSISEYSPDVIIFPHDVSISHWNWVDIVPALDQFMRNGGNVIFVGSNNYSFLSTNSFPSNSTDYITNEQQQDWFSSSFYAQQYQCCGIALENVGCPYGPIYGTDDESPDNDVYTYTLGVCGAYYTSPYYYDISDEDLNDDNFFSIYKDGGNSIGDDGPEWPLTQLVIRKHIGYGNLIFFGDASPNGAYSSTRNLLGNIIHYYYAQSGCTDPMSTNYDPDVTLDDGSCTTVQDLIDDGYSPYTLINMGVDVEHIYGSTYQGGLIFHIDIDNLTTYLATPMYLYDGIIASSIDWGCSGQYLGADGQSIGTGSQNTMTIVDNCEQSSPARFANDLEYEGYSDWFLPSIYELEKIYQNLHQNGFGEYGTSWCWASTEIDAGAATDLHFSNGFIAWENNKGSNGGYALAVRVADLGNKYVSESGSDELGDGSSNNPFASIQNAIDYSINGDSIFVSTGTYYENINFNGKNISIIGENRETTIIDGSQNNYNVVIINSGEDNSTLLSNLTIQNGNHNQSGTGVLVSNNSHPRLENLIIQNNYSESQGAGIFVNEQSTVLISNCIIRENTSSIGGGVFFDDAGGSQIINTDIINNTASLASSGAGGGGIAIISSSIDLINCNVSHNTTLWAGGGLVLMYDAEVNLDYTLISYNESNYGGGIALFASSIQINNSTIYENSNGGGVYSDLGSANISNSILWNNTNNDSNQQLGGGGLTISYSAIQGGWEGTGNIDEDPLFCDSENDDFTLYGISPCIGMGAYGVGCEVVYGCTDSLACEGSYNPEANINDGSCDYSCYDDYVLNFDGDNDYVQTEISYQELFGAESITIKTKFMWNAEDESGVSEQAIFSNMKSGDSQIGLLMDVDVTDGNRKLSLHWSDISTLDQPNMQYAVFNSELLNFNQWYNLMVKIEDNLVYWYLDNQLIETDNVTFTSLGTEGNNVPDLRVGWGNDIYDTFFNGQIDYIEISKNDEHILDYQFITGDGNTVIDHSGNQNHGIINGATWTISGNKYVSNSGSDELGNGSLDIPFASIQNAINYSVNGDSIFVSSGEYYENINFNGKNISLIGDDRETTIIDGNQQGSVVVFEGGENVNTLLMNFTLTNGYLGEGGTSYGGGIHITDSSPTISDCLIKNNHVDVYAAYGGGIYIHGSLSSPIIDKCLISNNIAHGWGGGIFIESGASPMIKNCTITENSYMQDGGGGIYAYDSGEFSIENSIVWNNFDSNGTVCNSCNILLQNSPEVSINNSNFGNSIGNWIGEGNINADPLFCDSSYELMASSPCIFEDGSYMGAYGVGCEPVYGCTDSLACEGSYNPEANIDDGSCDYSCYDNEYYSLSFDGVDDFVEIETIDELARLTLQNDPDKDSKIDLISGITNQAMSGEIDFPTALERRLQILSLTSDSIKEITHQITSLVSDSFKANKEIIKEHCDDIWIVSGGFSQIISAIVLPYGISGDHILANRFLFEGDQVIGCDKSNPLFQDKGKIKAIGSIETSKERVVVGDGYTDLEVYLEGTAEHFICFTENVHRKRVVNQSKHIASSFEQMLEIVNKI